MQVVISKSFGGFGLSYDAMMRYAELKGINLKAMVYDYATEHYVPSQKDSGGLTYFLENNLLFDDRYGISRTDPALIQVVQELGKEAGGEGSTLKIVTIPDDIQWNIDEYDGVESIHEAHRSWS